MKIVYLVSRIPYPINKGDKLRAYYQLKILNKHHDILLIALDEEGETVPVEKELLKICNNFKIYHLSKFEIFINLFSGLFSKLPFQVSYFYSSKLKNKIFRDIKNFQPDIIICQLIRMGEYVKDLKNSYKIIDFVDVLSKGLERRLAESNVFVKPFINIEYLRVLNYENLIFDFFDERIIISEQDKLFFPVLNKNKLDVIPNGVDSDYFKKINTEKKYDIIFTGNLSYLPNINACIFLVQKVLPLLKTRYNCIKILLVGSSPSNKVKSLQSKNVTVMSWVEDLRTYYSQSKVFVAPIFIGTGLQNKLLEAMSMELPCITSELVCKGLNIKSTEILLTANHPEEFAEKIIEVLKDDELGKNLSKNGRLYVSENYSWVKISENLNRLMTKIKE